MLEYSIKYFINNIYCKKNKRLTTIKEVESLQKLDNKFTYFLFLFPLLIKKISNFHNQFILFHFCVIFIVIKFIDKGSCQILEKLRGRPSTMTKMTQQV